MAKQTERQTLEAAAESEEAPTPDVPVNGVLVHRIEHESGEIGAEVQTLGDVKVTEIPTVLKLALKGVQARLGID